LRRTGVDLPEDAVKPLLPFVVGEDFQLYLFMLFEVYFLKRLENAVLEYCLTTLDMRISLSWLPDFSYPAAAFSRSCPHAAEMSLPRDSRTGAV